MVKVVVFPKENRPGFRGYFGSLSLRIMRIVLGWIGLVLLGLVHGCAIFSSYRAAAATYIKPTKSQGTVS